MSLLQQERFGRRSPSLYETAFKAADPASTGVTAEQVFFAGKYTRQLEQPFSPSLQSEESLHGALSALDSSGSSRMYRKCGATNLPAEKGLKMGSSDPCAGLSYSRFDTIIAISICSPQQSPAGGSTTVWRSLKACRIRICWRRAVHKAFIHAFSHLPFGQGAFCDLSMFAGSGKEGGCEWQR